MHLLFLKGEEKNVEECIASLDSKMIGMLLKMVHDAYYRREVEDDNKKKLPKTTRKVGVKTQSSTESIKVKKEINMSVGLLNTSSSSSVTVSKESSAASTKYIAETKNASSKNTTTEDDNVNDSMSTELEILEIRTASTIDFPKISSFLAVSS